MIDEFLPIMTPRFISTLADFSIVNITPEKKRIKYVCFIFHKVHLIFPRITATMFLKYAIFSTSIFYLIPQYKYP